MDDHKLLQVSNLADLVVRQPCKAPITLCIHGTSAALSEGRTSEHYGGLRESNSAPLILTAMRNALPYVPDIYRKRQADIPVVL